MADAPPALHLEAPWAARPVTGEGLEVHRVQRWMAEPHVAERWRQAWTLDDWVDEIGRQLGCEHSRPWTVWLDGEAIAYVEIYRVVRDVVAEHWMAEAGDLGIHIAIGAQSDIGRGLGTRVLRTVGDALFAAEPGCHRIVGDPAADHAAARRAFAAAGFDLAAEVPLPHKRAAIVVRRRGSEAD